MKLNSKYYESLSFLFYLLLSGYLSFIILRITNFRNFLGFYVFSYFIIPWLVAITGVFSFILKRHYETYLWLLSIFWILHSGNNIRKALTADIVITVSIFPLDKIIFSYSIILLFFLIIKKVKSSRKAIQK